MAKPPAASAIAASGDRANEAADAGDFLRADRHHRHAGGEKAKGLGDRVAGHLIDGAEMRVGAAEPGGNEDDPHMLDRREREQPLEIADMDQEQGGDADRDQPKADKPRPGIEPRRPADHREEPQDDVEHGRRLDPRQQRTDRGRSLAVRIGQPGVHRHEADLGPETDEDQQEGRPQQCRRHVRRRVDQVRPR